MIRPWHRSLLFHLGLPGLAFLVWAWIDSMAVTSMQGYHHGLHGKDLETFTYQNRGGALRLGRTIATTHYLAKRGQAGLTGFSRNPATRSSPAFPLPTIKKGVEARGSMNHSWTSLTIPHWLLILLYLAIWSLAFAWRSRRIQRSLTNSLPSPAQPQSD